MAASSTTMDMARLIGTLGAGITTGLMLSSPLLVFPALAAIPSISHQDRIRFWSKMYDCGAFVPPLLTLSALAFYVAAYTRPRIPPFPPPSRPFLRWVLTNRKLVLTIPDLCIFGAGLWTRVVMAPTISRLKHEQLQDGLIERWVRQHLVRTALVGVAFLVGLVELLAC